MYLPRNDIPNKIYQEDIRRSPFASTLSLFVYFSISIRAIQISLRTLLERVDPPNLFLLLSSLVFFSLETFNRSENLYAFSRYRKIYGCFSNKVFEIDSSTAQRIARWLIFSLASPLTHSLARSILSHKLIQRVNLAFIVNVTISRFGFLCIHTQSYYIMCKYEANADLVKSVLSTAFSFSDDAACVRRFSLYFSI